MSDGASRLGVPSIRRIDGQFFRSRKWIWRRNSIHNLILWPQRNCFTLFDFQDIRNIVNDAALLAVRDQSVVVEQNHMLHAIRRARAMKGNLSSSSNPTRFPFVLPQF
jgi:hypothetical protein